MVQKIFSYIRQYQIIEPQDKVIAGVSGGADSVCLFLVLLELKKELDFDLQVIHIEHGIRGQASNYDADFTKALCEQNDVQCQVIHVDVPKSAKELGLGTEEAARLLRYREFANYAKANGAKVALAHHEEDNAETILFQMIRGSGLHGLTGMPPIRRDENGICYIRPLLCVSRDEIEIYLKSINQSFCVDQTNFDIEYDRNRIRHMVIPQLGEINKKAIKHINYTAQKLSMIEDYMAHEIQASVDRILSAEDEKYIIDINSLVKLHIALQSESVLEIIGRAAGKKKDIGAVHVNQVISLARGQSGRMVPLPYKLIARREYDKIIIEKEKEENKGSDEIFFVKQEELEKLFLCGDTKTIELENEYAIAQIRVFSFDGDLEKIPKKPYTKWLCYDKIKDGFCFRKRKSGDYFISDVKGHKKKLKEYFINEKLPVSLRDDIWLLAAENEVLAIPGFRMSETYKVSSDTKEILEVQFNGGYINGFFKEV